MVSWGPLGKALPVGWGSWSWPSAQHQWGHAWSTVSSPPEADGHKLKCRRFLLNIRRYFSMWGWLNTGTSCPEILWSLHPSRYSRVHWIQSLATCSRWPLLVHRVGLEDLQRCLPTSIILWFCDLSLLRSVRQRMILSLKFNTECLCSG